MEDICLRWSLVRQRKQYQTASNSFMVNRAFKYILAISSLIVRLWSLPASTGQRIDAKYLQVLGIKQVGATFMSSVNSTDSHDRAQCSFFSFTPKVSPKRQGLLSHKPLYWNNFVSVHCVYRLNCLSCFQDEGVSVVGTASGLKALRPTAINDNHNLSFVIVRSGYGSVEACGQRI